MKLLNIILSLVISIISGITSLIETNAQADVSHTKVISAHHPSISAAIALERLKVGNKNYTSGSIRKNGQSQKDRERLLEAQNPHTIVFSCSDSRVPPEIIFDQKLGEIFVVRTAGEAVDNIAIASIEYAVEHLGPHLLLVLGHESCGAVKTALANFSIKSSGSHALDELVKDIQPHIKEFKGIHPSNGYISEVKANTLGVASELIGRSSIIANKIANKELQIETAVYHLGSGYVEFYSESPHVNLSETP